MEKTNETDFSSSLYNFLHDLPEQTLSRLYQSPSSCLAIFRLLPSLARHLILNLIWSNQSFNRNQLQLWSSSIKSKSKSDSSKNKLDTNLFKLIHLHLIHQDHLTLHSTFKENFQLALTGGGNHRSFGLPSNTSSDIDLNTLDQYAKQNWETILHFMVGSNWSKRPSQKIINLLSFSGLISSHNSKITSIGFQFLLDDINTQLWELLLQYLKMAEANDLDIVDVLSCLFMLGSLELGKEYSMMNLSETQIQVLNDLVDYGLVYLTRSNTFYPTRLATTLTSTAPPILSDQSDQSQSDQTGFLILETNYRTYAYTSNPLQIAILNLFITFKSRFPNLVVGSITRESIKSAFNNGIKANQIISYLEFHAHSQMKLIKPVLPNTVVDQIRLWELEKNRVRDQEGYLYEDFKSVSDYEIVINYSKQIDIILWENVELRKFFVSVNGHTALREFIKRRIMSNGN
ncbi:transcription factor Tfb2-domain-containing protein [Melampsora americana]|nr:transcription factor Tfb2-domain-containing protein [Melampsora americana]